MEKRRMVGIGLILFCLAIFLLITIPEKSTTIKIPIMKEGYQKGTLALSLPKNLRVGDTAKISLSIEMNSDESTQDTLDLVSRFEIGDLDYKPVGEIYAKVDSKTPMHFEWQVQSDRVTTYTGILWLFVQQKNQERQLILGREINLHSQLFLGLKYPTARMVAIGGILLGLILSLPFKIQKCKHLLNKKNGD